MGVNNTLTNITMDIVRKQIEDSLKVKKMVLDDEALVKSVNEAANRCIRALKKGNKILIAGNGGSAADAQHIAGELVNRFGFERPGLAAIAITTDTSVITSISNDYGFSKVFARQIEAIGKKGDVFISLSTSGTSENILEAIKEAKRKGIINIGLTGKTGGKMAKLCDLVIKVPSADTPRIQEVHILISHIICSLIEDGIFKKPVSRKYISHK
jgi:D-sedoheptulose 7-phosphate isomerase